MNIDCYRVLPGKALHLKKITTRAPRDADRAKIISESMPANLAKMADLQDRLYAENEQGLLICLQAMDAAGKDGIIRHVMTGLNPQGTQVTPFKQPSVEERDHDYLWRNMLRLPARGEIGIFNRSHYEEVIVTRIHDLLRGSQLPDYLIDEKIWETRYRQINDFERYLSENGIPTLKLFLHISPEEQAHRLLDRINQKEKNWKFSYGDIEERKYFDQYMKVYESVLKSTSTKEAPWYIIPADQKWFARYLVSEIISQKLDDMNPKYPKLSEDEEKLLGQAKEILEADLASYVKTKTKKYK